VSGSAGPGRREKETTAPAAWSPSGTWQRLTEPALLIRDAERRRQARLLATLLLVILSLVIAAVVLTTWDVIPGVRAISESMEPVLLAGFALLALAYLLSRTPHYTAAAGLTVSVLLLGTWLAASIDTTAPTTLAFMVLGGLLSNLFFSPRMTVGVFVATILAILLLPPFTGYPLLPVFQALFFVSMTGALVLIAAIVRHRDLRQIDEQSRLLSAELRERRRAQEMLSKLSGAVEQTADNVFICNRKGIIEYVNPAFERLTGYTRAEALGKTPRILNSGARDLAFFQELWHTILGGNVFRAEFTNRKKNGDLYYEEKTLTPIKDRDGSITHFVSTGKDVSERKRAEQELQRRADEFAALYETARALATEQDMPALLRATVEQATRLLGAPSGNIFLADRAAGDLVLTVAKGTSIQPGLRLGLGEGMAGRVAQTLEPLMVDDYRTWEHRSPQFTPSELGAIVQVPMLFAGELVGVLTVADLWGAKRTFSEADARLLTLLAGQAASAVHNARLLEETQRLARSDALTGIANRRYLFEAGEREIGRAHRFGHPLCALMFDIDHFKRVNDVYGHKRGDQVLQALAQCCLRQIRDVDILGRYGGEEFVILLVETDIPGARSVAERIRESVAQLLIATDEAAIRITISVGVACLGEGDSDLATLLGRSDVALYAAKSAGRNRVAVE
jgi:diguanylate cyclase (GGDEF)-like protein/PAS domain S-box-containing protein